MSKIKLFSKSEKICLVAVFTILVAIAIPNYVVSLRRARDQVRRDDLGALIHSVGEYYSDFGSFPKSSSDGNIVACLKEGDIPYRGDKGQWIINHIPCFWGVNAFENPVTKNDYMAVLPRDPNWQEGASYLYISDGVNCQIFAHMEGADEAEVDPDIISRNLMCGNQICNVGRSYNCDVEKSVEKCAEEAEAVKK